MEINPAASQSSSSHAPSANTSYTADTAKHARAPSMADSNSNANVDTTQQTYSSHPSGPSTSNPTVDVDAHAKDSEVVALKVAQDSYQDENKNRDGSSDVEAELDVGPDGAEDENTKPTLGKRAQKRLLKAQRREEQKLERRAREKAAKAAKKAERAAERAQGAQEERKERQEEKDRGYRKAELGAKRDRETLEALEAQERGGEDVIDDTSGERMAKRKKLGDDNDGIHDVHDFADVGDTRGIDGEDNDAHDPQSTREVHGLSTRRRDPPLNKDTFGAKVVIDLGFDDKMTERVCLRFIPSLVNAAHLYHS
jgi:hypothetical protein